MSSPAPAPETVEAVAKPKTRADLRAAAAAAAAAAVEPAEEEEFEFTFESVGVSEDEDANDSPLRDSTTPLRAAAAVELPAAAAPVEQPAAATVARLDKVEAVVGAAAAAAAGGGGGAAQSLCPNCGEELGEENILVGPCGGNIMTGTDCLNDPDMTTDMCFLCSIPDEGGEVPYCEDCAVGAATMARIRQLEGQVAMLTELVMPHAAVAASTTPLTMSLSFTHGGQQVAIKVSPAVEKELAAQLLKATGQEKLVLSAHAGGQDFAVATTAAVERELSVQVLRKTLGSEVTLTLALSEGVPAPKPPTGRQIGAALVACAEASGLSFGGGATPTPKMRGLMPEGLDREAQLDWAEKAYEGYAKEYKPIIPTSVLAQGPEALREWKLDMAYPHWLAAKQKKNATQQKWYAKSKAGGGKGSQ